MKQNLSMLHHLLLQGAVVIGLCVPAAVTAGAKEGTSRQYDNRLTPIENPQPLLSDFPEFVQPIKEERRFEAPAIIDESGADLSVRAWRFSYNARGIIEMPNHLVAANTAVICVHPWGIDDSQGWITPEPAGVADMCTPKKNHLSAEHTRNVIDPFLKRLRPNVALVLYSLRGAEHPVHAKLYRSIRKNPSAEEREEGKRELHEIMSKFDFHGQALPQQLTLTSASPVKDYFQQFPGLDAGPKFDPAGFWDLPIPICDAITMSPEDYVYYDEDRYPALRDFLKKQNVRHVLLVGYATDMCFCLTTAGYNNLSKDFNVFLVGDATLATFPANDTPKYATNAHISFASLNQLITQTSWVKSEKNGKSAGQ